MKWVGIDNKLKNLGFRLFTGREFQAVAGVSEVAAKFLLIRYTRKGLLRRLRRGLYASADRMPSPWFMANQLYRPSYISLESALSYYGLIPESIFAVTSVTTRATRELEAGDHLYRYRTIKRQAFCGYRSIAVDRETVLIAEREKALADYLYFVFLQRAPLNQRLSFAGIHKRKFQQYVQMFGKPDFLDWCRHDFEISDRRVAR